MTFNPPLFALAVGAFGIGVTEFAPMGMLPVIADDLGVSIPSAGLLVSAYATGVLVGAPIMTLLFARTPRRVLLIGLMAIFTLGNILSAVADGYMTLLVAGSSRLSIMVPSSASALLLLRVSLSRTSEQAQWLQCSPA